MKSFNIIFRNDLAELQKACDGVEGFLRTNAVPDDAVFTVHLILEEMLSNVIKYAFKDTASHDISLEISAEKEKLKIIIEDDGTGFNPISAPEKKTDAPLHEREIGGLGIHLVKNMVQDMSYCRKNGKNHLEMTVKTG
jgi:serine/threonine-protein kinase RsbW